MPVTIFNSQDTFYKTPFGAVRAGETVAFTLTVPVEFGCTTPYLLFNRDGEQPSLFPLQKQYFRNGMDVFSTTIQPQEPGLYFYYFDLYTGYRKLYAGQLGEAYVTTGDGEAWQLTVYEPSPAPDWFGRGVTYQIFPDRFRRVSMPDVSHMPGHRWLHRGWNEQPVFLPDEHGQITNRDFFGGSLQGITEKLDYLAGLGVTTLYLNPIFEAASNHRYDTGDYRAIDPLLGTEADFRALCTDAHALGMRVVLDGVFNHQGFVSRYFNGDGSYESVGAVQSQDSPYYPWYHFSHWPDKYDSWWGIYSLPAVNEADSSYRRYIFGGADSIIRRWLAAGADGWRLDVADELPGDFIEGIRSAIDAEKPGAYLLGEVWEDGSNKIAYSQRRRYLLGRQVHGLMNYPFRTALLNWLAGGDAAAFRDSMETIRENYPPFAFYGAMNFLGTHDTARILTLLGAEGTPKTKAERAAYRLSPTELARGLAKLRLAGMLLYSFPGSPPLFYGDEAGVQGFEDPLNRGAFPWGSEDAALTDFFRTLGQLRRTRESLRSGALRYLLARGGALAIERERGGERTVTALNAGDAPADLTLAWDAPTAQDAVTGQRFLVIDGKAHLTLPPLNGVILV